MERSSLPEEIRRAFRTAHSIEDVSTLVRTTARSLTGAHGATFVVAEGDLCFYVDEDAIAPLWRGQRFPMSECISGWAMRHGAQVAVPDIFADARIPIEAYAPTFVRSLLMTPVGHPPVAAIGVYWAAKRQPSPAETQMMGELAELTGAALERIGLDGAPWAPRFALG